MGIEGVPQFEDQGNEVPIIDESEFEPFLPKSPERFDSPSDVLIREKMGVEFIDPSDKNGERVLEGRVEATPIKNGETVVLIKVENETLGNFIYEVPLIEVQEHMFKKLKGAGDEEKEKKQYLKWLADSMN